MQIIDKPPATVSPPAPFVAPTVERTKLRAFYAEDAAAESDEKETEEEYFIALATGRDTTPSDGRLKQIVARRKQVALLLKGPPGKPELGQEHLALVEECRELLGDRDYKSRVVQPLLNEQIAAQKAKVTDAQRVLDAAIEEEHRVKMLTSGSFEATQRLNRFRKLHPELIDIEEVRNEH
jgi:hypothetical protein